VTDEELVAIKQTPVSLSITFNNQEWIPAKTFQYHDFQIERIAYAHPFMENAPGSIQEPEEREQQWLQPEDIEVIEAETEEERKKKEDEKRDKAQQETEESVTLAKRKGYRMFIVGTNFRNEPGMKSKFIFNGGMVEVEQTNVIFKNQEKLACEVPDLGADVPIGQHLITVEVSFNGQQYSKSNIQFMYNSVDPNLTLEDLKKMDEEENKA
jgi:hypothetical protein